MTKFQTTYIYADDINGWPLGYMEYYDHWYDTIAQCYYNKNAEHKEELHDALHNQRWHFARRISKTHGYAIPKFVLDMKLKKFIREEVEKVLAKYKPVQLEFKF